MSDVWRLSVCLTSDAYIGLNSRTERPRKTKIGMEVDHVTRVSDTTFKIKGLKVNLQGRGMLWRPPTKLVEFVLKNRLYGLQCGRHNIPAPRPPARGDFDIHPELSAWRSLHMAVMQVFLWPFRSLDLVDDAGHRSTSVHQLWRSWAYPFRIYGWF